MPAPHHSVFYGPDALPATQSTEGTTDSYKSTSISYRRYFYFSALTSWLDKNGLQPRKTYVNQIFCSEISGGKPNREQVNPRSSGKRSLTWMMEEAVAITAVVYALAAV